MKVYTETKFERKLCKLYGVAKCSFAKKGFSLTLKTKDEDGSVSTETYEFRDRVRDLPDRLPENFVLEEIKYAVVLSSDGSEINFIRPANLREANFVFDGFLKNDEGEYLLNTYEVIDRETKKKSGKLQIKYKALMRVVSDDPDDPYVGLQYPVTLPFTNSYGDPHIRRDEGTIMVQGNAEKSKPYATLLSWLEAVGISDNDCEDPDPESDDVQDWLAELERIALSNNRVVVGCDTTDGYITAWGESIVNESKKKSKKSAPAKRDEDDDEEDETPAKPSAKSPAKAPAKKATQPIPDDDDED